MSNIEPTEEQRQAAREACGVKQDITLSDDLARLLAEREAKLREEYQSPTQDVVISQLRARVAELEAKQARLKHLANDEVAACGVHIDSLEKLLAASTDREAQHLADIKAGRKAVAAWLDDPWLEGRRKLGEDFMAATAHYDDAKAAEGGEG